MISKPKMLKFKLFKITELYKMKGMATIKIMNKIRMKIKEIVW